MEMTLELDEDVAAAIKEILENEPDRSFELVVNELFRIGLANGGIEDERQREIQPFPVEK
ncbi:MAG: hypothetical protein IT173_01290 [Acidobacteria bacterium]|nr:hypothetical protein [Acidobacteriota bacterium]